MRYLVVDTETSHLPVRSLPDDAEEQPWAVEVAALLVGDRPTFFCDQIRSGGRKIRAEAAAVHGITSEMADRDGTPEISVLGHLCHLASRVRMVVGYNLDFDRKIIESLLLRSKKDTRFWVRPTLQFVDLMRPATEFCRLPSQHESGGYKWPSLDEASEIILQRPRRNGPHNAWEDCCLTRDLFEAMVKRNLLQVGA